MAVLGELVLPPGAKLSGGRGQAIAGDGKNLPLEGEAGADAEEVKDPVVGWLPAGLAPVTADLAPLPDPALLPPQSGTGIDAAVAAALPAQAAGKTAAEAAGAPVAQTLTVESEAPLPEAPEAVPEIDTRDKGDAPVRERVFRPSPASLIIPQPVVSGASAAQTAAQVFAAAISASFDAPAAPRAADPVAMQAQTAATEQLRTTVQAMSGADQAPLDLSRDDWAGRMVDRIAALRDAAEATDTRIRLAPENLGNVDVSIRRDGDRLHVHFTAENPAARQLIAEAAPRLSELAEARGVKLGQTSVDAGTGGQSQGQPGQPQSHRPARPASAAAHTTQSSRDDRVA
jgi:flagellar hook-length control protein FliK